MATPLETSEKKQVVPARLQVILAAKAPKAVILRRGPSAWVQLILWHTDTDTFEYGQWFHGRVHEEYCDLSPDGSTFVYAVDKYNRFTLADAEYTQCWTAISKPPYFTALALWPVGHGPGPYGGFFLDNETLLFLWEGGSSHPNHKPTGIKVKVDASPEPEESIIRKRFRRGGWEMVRERVWDQARGGLVKPELWEKSDERTGCIMTATATYHGYRNFKYAFQCAEDGAQRRVSWVDTDQKGRLVYADEGKLLLLEKGSSGLEPQLIVDLNPQQFTEVVAPEWATRW